MKTPLYAHDFTQLEELLVSQFEPQLLAQTLEESLYAIVQHGLENGENTGLVMQRFDATFTLMNIFKRMHLQEQIQTVERSVREPRKVA